MTRAFAAASLVCLLLMLFAPGIANSATPAAVRRSAPPTNTPRAVVHSAMVPTLTPAPCPAPVEVHEIIDGVAYTGLLTAVC